MSGVRDFAEAALFAARAHAGQRRKGAGAEPCVNHVLEVAVRLARARPGDGALILAGLLHDVVEDTGHGNDEIAARFGAEVAGIVAEVTDAPGLSDAERKRRQVARVAGASDAAKRLKLADKASNLAEIADRPPEGWSLGRRREYLAWAREVAAGRRGVDAGLEAGFEAEASRLEAQLAAEAAGTEDGRRCGSRRRCWR